MSGVGRGEKAQTPTYRQTRTSLTWEKTLVSLEAEA